jgi:hypothetical protein
MPMMKPRHQKSQVPEQVWVAEMLQSDWLKKYQFSDGIFHQIQN